MLLSIFSIMNNQRAVVGRFQDMNWRLVALTSAVWPTVQVRF